MAQTTTQQSGRDVKVTLNSVDISGSSNSIEIKSKLKVGSAGTFDGDWLLKTPGKREWDGSLNAIYTETAGEAFATIWAAFTSGLAVALKVSPKGGGVGDWEFSGNVIISEAPIKIDADKADPMMIAVKFEGTGDLTKAAIATT
jgi:hypothetical protein